MNYRPTTDEIIRTAVAIFIRTAQPVTASDVAAECPSTRPSAIGRALASAFAREGWKRISPVTITREFPNKSYGAGVPTVRKVTAYVVPASHLCEIIRGNVRPS